MRSSRAIVIAMCFGFCQCGGEETPSQEGGVGLPCTPSLEKDAAFAGFRITETTIEAGAPECGGGVCLVNHFQGRVSCPLGQPEPTDPPGASGCQDAGAPSTGNAGKGCCGAGTDAPVVAPVCGQCLGTGEGAARGAENAVYCTCRCGVADGEPDEPDFDFCTCPEAFECSEIRPYTGVGDKALTGKFCIRAGTAYDPNQDQCGFVDGYWSAGNGDAACGGVPSGKCQSPDGPCDD